MVSHDTNPSTHNLASKFYRPLTDTSVASCDSVLGRHFDSPKMSCTTTVPTTPCINVTKTCPATVPFGTTSIPFSGVVTNCGDVTITNVTVVDDNGTPANTADDITIHVADLLPHTSAPYSGTHTVGPNFCGPLTDIVVASGDSVCGGHISASATCTTTVPTTPCIDVTKTCIDTDVLAGTPIRYSFTVKNCGDVPLQNVVAVDDSGTPGNTGDDVKTTIGDLAIGETKGPFTGTIATR